MRQLQNTIQRLVALGTPGPVSADAIRSVLSVSLQPEEEEEAGGELSEVERRQILRVLSETGGNKTRAAEVLGIQRRTLYKKLARMDRERNTPPETR